MMKGGVSAPPYLFVTRNEEKLCTLAYRALTNAHNPGLRLYAASGDSARLPGVPLYTGYTNETITLYLRCDGLS